VDGCRSTLPSAKLASFPRNADGTVRFGSTFTIQGAQTVSFPVHLRVENGHLLALRPDGEEYTRDTQRVTASASAPCSEMVLEQPVDFFVAEHAAIPTALGPGQQLWIEVTIPPARPVRCNWPSKPALRGSRSICASTTVADSRSGGSRGIYPPENQRKFRGLY
jgi:hypothetical protein